MAGSTMAGGGASVKNHRSAHHKTHTLWFRRRNRRRPHSRSQRRLRHSRKHHPHHHWRHRRRWRHPSPDRRPLGCNSPHRLGLGPDHSRCRPNRRRSLPPTLPAFAVTPNALLTHLVQPPASTQWHYSWSPLHPAIDSQTASSLLPQSPQNPHSAAHSRSPRQSPSTPDHALSPSRLRRSPAARQAISPPQFSGHVNSSPPATHRTKTM